MTKFQTLFQQLIAPLNVNYHKIASAIIFQSIIIIYRMIGQGQAVFPMPKHFSMRTMHGEMRVKLTNEN